MAVDLLFVSNTSLVSQVQVFFFLSVEYKVHSLHHLISQLLFPELKQNNKVSVVQEEP